MTKNELATALIERLRDPWDTQCDEDVAVLDFIDVDQAVEALADLRRDEDAADLEPDERLSQEVTPELYMEVWNCEIRRCRHDLKVRRLAEWLTENECVCIHNRYHHDYTNDDPDVEPMDFLYEYNLSEVPFISNDEDVVDILTIGMRSVNTFTPADDYYWYDEQNNMLRSSNTPFADNVIDADALARYAIDRSDECLEEILSMMDDKDRVLVFGTADEKEVLNNG